MSNILFKKVTASVAALSIVLSIVAPITGVKAADSSVEAANRLASLGVIVNSSSNPAGYNLNSSITRREMLKVMMNLSSVEVTEKCEGKFSDLKSSDWGCKYAEAALAAGFIAANPKFRPNDLVTEAEALKMIMQATGVAKKEGVDDWADAYRQAAVEAEIIAADTKISSKTSAKRSMVFVSADSAVTNVTDTDTDSDSDTGTDSDETGTGDTATGDDTEESMEDLFGDLFGEDEGTDMTSTGNTITLTGSTSTGTTDTTSTGTTSVTGGNVEVTLNPATSAATSVPSVASAVPYAAVDFTAGDKDTSINTVVLTRQGFGARDDLYRVWFELDGVRVSERASFLSDDTATVNFNPAFVIKAGSTQTLKIVAEQRSNTNVINRVAIVSASSIKTTGGEVKGNFPIVGNNMTAASYTVATLNLAYQGSSSDYKVGDKNVEFARVQVLNQSSDKDVKVQSLSFRNSEDGDIAEDLENIALYEGGVKVSTDSIVSGRDVTFRLKDYVVKAGVSKTFIIQADAKNARNTSGDKFKFEIRYQEDLNAIELATGFGAPNNVTSIASNVTYTVKGSSITVSRSSSSPSTQTVSQGTNDVVLLIADATINQAFRADGLNLTINTTGLGPLVKNSDSFGNIRVYIGDRIYNSFDFATGDVGPLLNYVKAFDSSWTFDQGKTTIKVVVNAKSAATVGATISATLGDLATPANGFFKSPRYTQNDNTVAATDISVSAAGLATGVGNDRVNIVRNDGFSVASSNVVAGVQNTTIYKGTISAGNVSDVRISKLSFDISSALGAVNLLTNFRVKINGEANGSPRSISTSAATAGTVNFTDSNFTVEKNKTAQIEVIADIGTGYGASTLLSLLNKTNSTFLNVTSGQTIAAGDITAPAVAAGLAIVAAGELTVAKDGNTPNSAVVVAGTQNVELARFKLSTKYDEMYLRDLYVSNTVYNAVTNDTDSRVAMLKLYDSANPSVALASTPMTSGVAHFSIGDNVLKLLKDDSKVIIVKADFNTVTTADQTGKTIKLAIDETKDGGAGGVVAGTVDGLNVSSVSTGIPLTVINGVANATTTATTVNEMQIRKTSVTITAVNLSNSTFAAANGKEIYRFKVSADASGDAYLKKITLDLNLSNASLVQNSIKLYKVSDQSSVLATDTLGANLAANGKVSLVLGTEQTIAKGSEVEFVVKADILKTDTGDKGSISTSLVETIGVAFAAAANYAGATGDFIFSDNAGSQAVRNGLSVDYFSGFRTASFPTDVKSLTE